ncbi:hypothetical protein [Leptolyngbya sp. GGD]|uniref:hypothetical protein n=1 Tax=Leptolyngbya sp. GGD TaxID=2997907 RepID=UPI00227A256B|nr:hypothetical protein [Leptolyngbya sp. GGD]MCY6493141.1 hypothetical protein [Leptolyngbya sp. GGD]
MDEIYEHTEESERDFYRKIGHDTDDFDSPPTMTFFRTLDSDILAIPNLRDVFCSLDLIHFWGLADSDSGDHRYLLKNRFFATLDECLFAAAFCGAIHLAVYQNEGLG